MHTWTSAIFRIFMFLCSTFVDVNLSSFNINFKSLFCITCNLFTLRIEVLPYISMPYFILEKIKAWYNWRATLGVILFLMWLNIPKYFTSDLQSSLTWSFQCNVSSSVRPRYLNELILFIVINSTLISSKFLGISLLIVWKRIKFVFSALIVNLLLLHHFIKCLNFVLMSHKSCVKFVCDINSAVSSANNLQFSGPTAFN